MCFIIRNYIDITIDQVRHSKLLTFLKELLNLDLYEELLGVDSQELEQQSLSLIRYSVAGKGIK